MKKTIAAAILLASLSAAGTAHAGSVDANVAGTKTDTERLWAWDCNGNGNGIPDHTTHGGIRNLLHQLQGCSLSWVTNE